MILSTAKICRLDTKPFIGLAFMVKPLVISPEEIETSKYGESLERVNIKARVFDVVLGPQASDLKFHLATIDDKIYDVDAAKVFNFLGPNLPKSFQRLQDEFLGIRSKQDVRTCVPERHVSARQAQEDATKQAEAVAYAMNLPSPARSKLDRVRVLPKSLPGAATRKS